MRSGFKILLALMLCCPWGLSAHAQAAYAQSTKSESDAAFVADSTDIPVMPGLVEDLAARVIFDKADGRIIEARLIGRGSVVAESVEESVVEAADFYRESLGQMGWIMSADDPAKPVYCREGERLKIRFMVTEGRLTIDFSLSPALSGQVCGG